MMKPAPRKDPPMVTPRPDSEDELLDEGLQESFPASDTPSSVRPHHHQPANRPVWDQRPETD
jgi:hypothetical protein